jgi:hypothetical protein
MKKFISAAFFACIAISGNSFAAPIGGSTGNTGGYVLCKDGSMYGYYNPGSTDYGPDVSYESAVEKCKTLGGGLARFNPRSGPIKSVRALEANPIKAGADKRK